MGVILQKAGKIEYFVAEGIAAPHCFTTRLGGVSTGSLQSLNLGMARGDDPQNVVENYRRLGRVLGFGPEQVVVATQTHSAVVLQVDGRHAGAGLTAPKLPECDGLITDTPGLALFVSTADCTPVLIHDPDTGAVGAVHAGWRGTAAAIAQRAVEAMARAYGSRPERLRCAIGPNIGRCHFETDADVPRAMLACYGREAELYIEKRGEKYFLDLKAINALALRRAGVTQIELSTACTVCRTDRFWSHRVTGGDRGAQGAIIVCKEVGP